MPSKGWDLTICGLDELGQHRERAVSHVLSILDPGYPDPADFGHYGRHHRLTLRFHDIVAERPGLIAPSAEHVRALIAFGADLDAYRAEARPHLLVHCHAGVSRSTAAMAILLARHLPGREGEAFDRLGGIRAGAWPNSRMIGIADDLLGCGGRLVAALRGFHRRQALDRPDLAQAMRADGRGMDFGDLP